MDVSDAKFFTVDAMTNTPTPAQALGAKLEASSIPVPESGCWLWLKGTFRFGYGNARVNGKTIGAHRASWIAYRGPIPDGLCVCHKCDTPQCINPDHLYLGTKLDNARDMHRRGRNSWTRHPHLQRAVRAGQLGEKHSRNKLTDSQVLDARRMRSEAAMTYEDIARYFGVWNSTIRRICIGLHWTHLND